MKKKQPEKKVIPIISQREDICTKMRRTHKLTLKEGLSFTGFEILHQTYVETASGTVIANKGDWTVFFPDGSLYVISDKLFKIMFNNDIPMHMVGKPCVNSDCTGIYGKWGPNIRCTKCHDRAVV